jgi:hypothetical protein
MEISKHTVPTWYAKIYCGLRVGYGSVYNTHADAYDIIKEFIKEYPTCVNVTRNHFLYVNGEEPGICVEFINYPRFESSYGEIERKAIKLATRLMKGLKQNRVSIVMPGTTIMLQNEANATINK